MSNLINLDELVPGIQGTTFTYQGSEYKLRGDLPSEQVFEFLALYDELLAFRARAVKAAEEGKPDAVQKIRSDLEGITGQIRERLLDVFQLEHPDMEKLPFGNQTTLIVLAEVLKTMGVGAVEAAPDPPTPARPKRKRAAKPRSRTSSHTKRATAPRSKGR